MNVNIENLGDQNPFKIVELDYIIRKFGVETYEIVKESEVKEDHIKTDKYLRNIHNGVSFSEISKSQA